MLTPDVVAILGGFAGMAAIWLVMVIGSHCKRYYRLRRLGKEYAALHVAAKEACTAFQAMSKLERAYRMDPADKTELTAARTNYTLATLRLCRILGIRDYDMFRDDRI